MKKSEVRRLKERASYDLDELFSFLNKTHFVTVSFIQKETIFSIPMLHAVYNEKIYLHAAVGSRITKELTNNASVTLSATDVHGIVLSKSLFNSSMNYQSAVVFGETKRIDDEEIMYAAFENMVDRFFKGRFEDARKPTKNEWLQTAMLEFTINEFSLKQRTGMPKEEESDKTLPIWSGVVPLKSEFVEPEPNLEHSKGIELPDYLKFT
ncbi:pyridoxamine 5'-phosphate oxidase family protein [Acidimicrobiia bacterium]|nr:pyridoxamine 5'-phosphate oxidase family protein [Acidimicrobiia bacterium]